MSVFNPVLKVVSCSPSAHDPALSDEMLQTPEGAAESLLARYVRERDPELVRVKEGTAPTWFHLRRLPLAFLTDVLDLLNTRASQRRLAFRAACFLVEAPDGPLRVVAPKESGEYVAQRGDHGVMMAPEAWAQAIADRFGADVVMEMGEIAITASRLRPGARGPFGFWGGSAASP